MTFKSVYIMGLGYTGSSAIIDELYKNNQIIGLESDYPDETSFFKENKIPLLYIKKYGLFDLDFNGLLFLMTKSYSYLNKSRIKNQLKLRLKNIGQFKINKKKSGVVFNLNSNLIENLINNYLKYETEDDKSTERYFELLNELTIQTSIQTSKTVCFNNDLVIHKSKSKEFFSNNLKILIYRNPLDNISDLIEFYNRKSKPRIIFIFTIALSRVKHYVQLLSKDFLNDSYFIMINFEDYLTSEELRKNISKLLIDGTYPQNDHLFDINLSRLNVGIYREKLKMHEIIIIQILTHTIYSLLKKIYSIERALRKINYLRVSNEEL